jgi:hypothetical protein
MEPNNMNPQPSDDAGLEALLRVAAPALRDDGFSRQLLATLPPRRKEKSWRTLAYGLAAAGVLLALGVLLVRREGTLTDLVRTVADPMFAGAVLAMAFSLLVAFRAELRERLFGSDV